MIKIQPAETTEDIGKCFPIMLQLRPDFTEEKFITQVKRQQHNGYHIVFLEDNDELKSVAGFHIAESLSWKKYLYVDDFITEADNRSKGYGKQLFDWLIDYAKSEHCDQMTLDSGVEKERFDAHRFYLNKKMNITAHHFVLMLS